MTSESVILSWLEEDDDTDVAPQDIASDCVSDEPSEHSLHKTDTEQSDISDNDIEMTDVPNIQPIPPTPMLPTGPYYTGKDNYSKWYVHKQINNKGKTAKQNIVTKLPGVTSSAKNCKSAIDSWKIFFSDVTLNNIVTFTNDKLSEMALSYKHKEKDCPQTDIDELLAFFGVLYMLGVKKANHLNTAEMWQTNGTAPEFFRAVMCERRFHQLYRAIRFDDRRTRNTRQKIDNLAPIRQMFESFVSSCISNYTHLGNTSLLTRCWKVSVEGVNFANISVVNPINTGSKYMHWLTPEHFSL